MALSFSEALFGLKECKVTDDTDPEWPKCARLSLMGKSGLTSWEGHGAVRFFFFLLFSRSQAFEFGSKYQTPSVGGSSLDKAEMEKKKREMWG